MPAGLGGKYPDRCPVPRIRQSSARPKCDKCQENSSRDTRGLRGAPPRYARDPEPARRGRTWASPGWPERAGSLLPQIQAQAELAGLCRGSRSSCRGAAESSPPRPRRQASLSRRRLAAAPRDRAAENGAFQRLFPKPLHEVPLAGGRIGRLGASREYSSTAVSGRSGQRCGDRQGRGRVRVSARPRYESSSADSESPPRRKKSSSSTSSRPRIWRPRIGRLSLLAVRGWAARAATHGAEAGPAVRPFPDKPLGKSASRTNREGV